MNNTNVDKIKYFIEQNIVFKDKPNYKNLQNTIGTILEEIKNNPQEYNELLKIFRKDYGWNKEILDALLNNDLNQFTKLKIKLDQNILKEIKEIETNIRKILKNNNEIPNIEKLFPLIELKDKQLMEFKSLLNIYVIKQFQKDIKSGIYNNITEEKLLEKLIEQVNNHIIKYKKLSKQEKKIIIKEEKELIIKEEIIVNDKNKKEYHLLINSPRIKYNNSNIKLDINTSNQIDTLMFFEDEKESKIIGEDVTADYTGKVDRHEEYNVKEDTLLRHEESLNKMSKIFKVDYEYYFDVNILFNINNFLKDSNHYEYDGKVISNKEKYSSEAVIGFLKLIIKNYHLNNEGLSSSLMKEYRGKVKSNLFKGKNKGKNKGLNKGLNNETYIDIKNSLNINNEDFMEGLKLFSLIKNKSELKELLEYLYLNKNIKNNNQNVNNKEQKNNIPSSILSSNEELFKEIDKDKLKNLLETMGQLILLYNNESGKIITKNNEINPILLTNIFNTYIYITHSIYYLKFAKLELLNCLNNESITPEFSQFMEKRLYLNKVNAYQFELDITIKLQNSEKKLLEIKSKDNQAEEKVNQAEEKEEEKDKLLKEKEEEKYQEKKESFINLINMLKEEDIIKALNIKESDIQRLIKEGIIDNKVIIEKYKSKEPERRKNSKKRTEMENLIIENYCISRMNINNKNEEMIKKDFFELIGKEKLLKDKDFNKQYENIKKEGEFYLKIIHLYELDLKKRKKELKPELVGSQYYDKIKTKVEELEKQSDFLIKHKRIEKEDKDTFITFLLNEFKQIENKHFEEKELLLIADKYIKWKIIQTQNKENEIKNNENKTVVNNKTINNDLPILE
jgi:hypothetical protein